MERPSDIYDASTLKTIRRRGLTPPESVTYNPDKLGLRPSNPYEAANMAAVTRALAKMKGGTPFRGVL